MRVGSFLIGKHLGIKMDEITEMETENITSIPPPVENVTVQIQVDATLGSKFSGYMYIYS